MKIVLYLKATDRSAGRRMLSGFMEHATSAHWDVQILDPVKNPKLLRQLIAFWNPDGAVVNCGSGANDFHSSLFGCPVVYLDRPHSALRPGDSCIVHDSVASSRLAAKLLLSLGFRHFAFIGWPVKLVWDSEREHAFKEAIKLNGHETAVFHPEGGPPDSERISRDIERFLKTLPLPVGIFASTDIIAGVAISAAKRLGLSIPDQVSIIGVDNDEDVCEFVSPSLTSIEPDWRLAGRLTAEVLDTLMSAPDRTLPVKKTYPPVGIIHRESTRRLRHPDPEVSAALELIRREACSSLTARRALACFSCSRRMAEMRFRELTGNSILGEIRAVRLAKAKRLLLDGRMNLKSMANFCGYASAPAFSSFIKSETGMTPGQLRRQLVGAR